MPSQDERDLIEAWSQEMDALTLLAQTTPPDAWSAHTRLTGWSIADIFAHICDIESILVGEPRTTVEPDWSSLPHVDNDISRFTEIGVDIRRAMSQTDVIAELSSLHRRRIDELRRLPPDAEVPGPTGRIQPLSRVLTMRCFDLVVHERDVRDALDLPTDATSSASLFALDAGVELAMRAWQGRDPSPGHLVITVSDATPPLQECDFGGTGESLHLACTKSELLDIVSGRTLDGDPRWRGLNIAP